MGLLRAGIGAAAGVLADTWREFFYCDSMPADTLAVKGQRKANQRGTANMGGENIISDGSIIAVNEGQCMMIVETGKVVELCAEAGEFVYDQSTEPSIFTGKLGDSLKATFEQIGKRFTFGGDPAKDQRVYFFNTKEIIGNKYGTSTPVPFRVVDRNIGLDVDISVRCNGEYSYRISDPMLFYTNVCGNFEGAYKREQIDSQLRSELLTALQPAFARISEMGIRYSAVPGHTAELASALNDILSSSWSGLRGISVASLGMNSIAASPEDEAMIKDLQRTAVMRDPSMAAATLTQAQGEAMRTAAGNEGGAFIGFAGLNMAAQAGGMNAQGLYQMTQAPAAPSQGQPMAAPSAPAPAAAGSWTCSCGATNTGRFCQECGSPRPQPAGPWTCSCGATNTGRFCQECGKPRP